MIYTVTFNPSLDYVIGAEKLEPGKINRTTRENIYPGGKGNNVSVVLSNLGHKSKALGFVSGFTGEALRRCWMILAVIPILSSWITDLPESM